MAAQAAFCYRTGDFQLVLEPAIRSEILSRDRTYPVPFAPQWCAGLVSVRGELYPVIDMHRVLLNRARPEKQYLLWLQHEQFAPVAISCDALPKQVDLSAADEDSQRLPGLPGWIRNSWVHNNEVLLGADHLRLFKMLVRQVQ